MSGYLGRMLRTTARNEHRLRPLAGSIFGERGDAATFAGDAGPGEMPKAAEDRELGEIERTMVSRGASERNAHAHADEPIKYLENFEPLYPRRQERETQRSGSAESSHLMRVDADTIDERHLTRRIERRGEELRTAARTGADGGSMRGRPAMDPEGLETDSAEAHTARDAAKIRETVQARNELISQRALQPIVTARESAQPSRRQRVPQHETQRDAGVGTPDVQVHIGRIEVLAVQPHAPIAPAPRRPRTTSLADYMAGRNGRGS